ncbi:MAG: DEAD/DEAH box helicase [Burkholderiales bacterium]|nr:DEAD/DEAH box helicase [Burkholderiales bacterium]MBH2015546.1 DEAD/DEAH box helicase [Burkholderiales bacterium]
MHAPLAFADLGLSPALVQVTDDAGFTDPTPVQREAIPAALSGRDVLALASTGSGKTLAYVLPILQQVEAAFQRAQSGDAQSARAPRQAALHAPKPERRPTRALILVPTRELALQVGEALSDMSAHLQAPLRWGCVFGGVSINTQMLGLRGGADVVVATPGRLLDLIEHNALSLDGVQTLVLDEADRLLDKGFEDELNRVLALLPKRRQHLLLSATFAPGVEALAQQLLHDAVRIDQRAEAISVPDIQQRAIVVDAPQRTPLLRHLIAQEGWRQVLVFVATRYACNLVAHKLQKAGIQAAAFHADASQGARREVLRAFKAGELQVVVATDLAARGIDIAQLPAVVNHDLPRSPDDHIHRIGRTARAGHSGVAVSFVSADTEAHFRLIEKRQGLRVPREQVAGFEPTQVAPTTAPSPTDPDGTGGVKGKRKSKKDKLREAHGKMTPS